MPDPRHNARGSEGQPAYLNVHPYHRGCTDSGDLGPCDCLCHRDESPAASALGTLRDRIAKRRRGLLVQGATTNIEQAAFALVEALDAQT